jgi:hypothetical protein
MCGHALFLAEQYLRGGAGVAFPVHEDPTAVIAHPEARIREARDVLTDIRADADETLSEDLLSIRRFLSTGKTVVLMLAGQDPKLPEAIMSFPDVHFVCLVYDIDDYQADKRPGGPSRAADPTYLARLEAAGATVNVMPKVESLG